MSQPSNSHSRWSAAKSVEGPCSPPSTSSHCLLDMGEAPQWASPVSPFPLCTLQVANSTCHSPNTLSMLNTHSIASTWIRPSLTLSTSSFCLSFMNRQLLPGFLAQPRCSHCSLHTFILGLSTQYCIYLFLSAACPQTLYSSWQLGADRLALNSGRATLTK